MRARHPLWCLAASAMLAALVEGSGCALVAGIDEPSKTCANGILDSGEEGIDCGGVCRGACAGQRCSANTDCASFVCDHGTCASAVCTDKVWNGAETDVDCGGPNTGCPRCAAGKLCGAGSDCASTICSANVCSSCMHCSDYLTAKSRPNESVLCQRSIFDELVKCTCYTTCARDCGFNCSKVGEQQCQDCVQKPDGCLTAYNACMADR